MANIINKFSKNQEKIKLIKYLNSEEGEVGFMQRPASAFKNIELVRPKITKKGYDIIKVWNNKETEAMICLGHWNDGVI